MIAANRRVLVLALPCLILLYFVLHGGFSSDRDSVKAKADAARAHQSNATSFDHIGVLDETAEGAPKILQVSMQFNGQFNILYERGLRSHVKYGEKWGYPTHYLRQDIVGSGDAGEGMYNKLLYMLSIMVGEHTKPYGKRAEWIVWFDADTAHLNDQIPWTIFLPPTDVPLFRDINMLINRDWTGFNAGVFIIRICEWSIKALTDAIAVPRLRPEVDTPYREQDALWWVLSQPVNKRHRIYQPHHWWNQYPEFYNYMGEKVMHGTIHLHFPGMGTERPNSMGGYLDKIEAGDPSVSVPLQDTKYPAEIEAYWSRLRSAAEILQRAEEYKEEVKEKEWDIFTTQDGKWANLLGHAENELKHAIEEAAYDKSRLKQMVVKLDDAVRDCRREVDEREERKKEEEEKREQEAKEREERKKKKEGEKGGGKSKGQ